MHEKILIVDDEPDVIETLEFILTSPGYRICKAFSGKEAVERFRSEPADLVITDLRMPDMEGTEVLRLVKAMDPFVEVILLTGYATLESAIQALRSGAFDFLTKPLESIDELYAIVQRAMEKRRLTIQNQELIKALHREKTLLQSVFDGIQEPMVLLGPDLTIITVNRAAVAYLGLTDGPSLIGKYCHEVLRNRNRSCEACQVCAAVSEKRPVFFERRGLMDPERWEQVTVYPIAGGPGEDPEEGCIVRSIDITERKKIEEQMIRADRLSSLGQLSGGIAHEIRNPLTGIRLFTDILCGEEAIIQSDRYREMLEEIRENVKRIEEIIKRVLEYARPPKRSMENIQPNVLIEETLKLWLDRLRKAGIRTKLSLDEKTREIHGDRVGLQQVVNNLILNAIEAMEGGGVLSIFTGNEACSTDKNRDSVVIRVEDTGPGIAPELAQKLFVPFFTTKPLGTGLGLPIAHQIISRHGGTILFQSRSDKGTRFTVELPAAQTT